MGNRTVDGIKASRGQDDGRYCQGEWDTDTWATNLVDHFSLWVEEGRLANLPECYNQLKNLVRQSVRFILDEGHWPGLRSAVRALPELIPCEGGH